MSLSESSPSSMELAREARAFRATRLESARAELTGATEMGQGGRAALRQYSQRMDALIQLLFAEAGLAAQPVGVFALGGYGRRQLCLHSDIDLLILFSSAITAD